MCVRLWLLIYSVVFLFSCSQKTSSDVEQVREFIRSSWDKTVRNNQEGDSTLIGLPYPYTVPCINEGFQEMYYWDTYFTNEGMILDGHLDYAKNNVDNMLYMVDKFGKMLNGNRTFYLNRSQPPYLSMMVARVYQENGDKKWLRKAYETLKKEYKFWMTERMSPVGLNHYDNSATQASVDSFLCVGSERLGTDFSKKGLTNEQLNLLGRNLLAECESGWDMNPRYEMRCLDFCPIDLNSNLYLYEKNFAYFTRELGIADSSKVWLDRAAQRKALLKKYCYNKADKLYYDYDYVNNRQSDVVSAAIFSLMYAKVVDQSEANDLVKALDKLEFEYGVSTCENRDYQYSYQWSYPNGWAPLQYLAVRGLDNYGFRNEAQRIAHKYVDMVTNTYKTTGHLWEKYNIRKGNADVRNEYEMPTMLGWSAGVYVYLTDYLDDGFKMKR